MHIRSCKKRQRRANVMIVRTLTASGDAIDARLRCSPRVIYTGLGAHGDEVCGPVAAHVVHAGVGGRGNWGHDSGGRAFEVGGSAGTAEPSRQSVRVDASRL